MELCKPVKFAPTNWGFKSSRCDPRIYFLRHGTDFLIIAIVVYDLAFASNSTRLMMKLKQNVTASFQVKLLDNRHSFLDGKHIDLMYQFVKMAVASGLITLTYV